MRNPIRLKNVNFRYLPWYGLGLVALLWSQPDPVSFGWGATLAVCGLLLRSWGAGYLVKNDSLTTSGPYRHVRHPLYLGTLLIGIGFALIVGGWWTLVLLPFLAGWFFLQYFPRKERSESARLEGLYGDRFVVYREQVPALIPWWGRVAGSESPGSENQNWSLARYSDNNELGTLIAVLALLLLCGLRWGLGT